MIIMFPMAGSDQFFDQSEYHFPKPLVEVNGQPMIAAVVEPFRRAFPDAKFVFVAQAEHLRGFNLDGTLRLCGGDDTTIVSLASEAKGAVCSSLMAIEHVVPDEELLICNADQILEVDLRSVIASFRARELDAGVVSFPSVHPRWSYILTDASGFVNEASEKRVISKQAIAGFYYYRKGKLFIDAAMESIRRDDQINGAFYLSLTLNQMVLNGSRIGHFPIPAEAYQSLYSPQRVQSYERSLQTRKIEAFSHSAADTAGVTVVIPMAGKGSRFANAGYEKPKPFIDVGGSPMIERVIENIGIPGAHYLLLARAEHLDEYAETFQSLAQRYSITVKPVGFHTEGSACTVLLARNEIDNDKAMLIANCDQIVDFDFASFVADSNMRGLDGSILVFREPGRSPKWSYARLDRSGLVTEVKEKVAISDLATVGVYYFRKGSLFVKSAIDMIVKNDRVNNEFYTCPVYNYAIADGAKIGVFEIPATAMHGTGTPEDLQEFLALRRAV